MELAQFQQLNEDELALAARQLRRAQYQVDPDFWLEKVLREQYWSKQREIAQSVVRNRYTAVKSCHDVGKSFVASRIAAWWLDDKVHEPGSAFVVSTAPTGPQVKAILWRYINRAHNKGDLVGRVNQTEWWIGEELVGYGRKPSDYDPSAFQGIHARYVLVIIDEACGIPQNLWDAADTLVTNEESRILAIGNPDDPQSHFSTVAKPGSGWNTISISAYESPNFTGEQVPDQLRSELISPIWVEERKERWGIGSPLYVSKVLGEFPEDAEDGVIPLSWIRKCQEGVEPEGTEVEIGLDVGASVDGDETVIRAMTGNKPSQEWAMRTAEAEEIVGAAVKAINELNAVAIKVDVIGVGFAIAGWLETQRREGIHKARVLKVNVANKASQPKRFHNLRSQLWWNMREMIEQQAIDLSELDEDTIGELIAPKYAIDATGRIQVEKKADTKERIGRSPDHADAFLLANYKVGRPVDIAVAEGRI